MDPLRAPTKAPRTVRAASAHSEQQPARQTTLNDLPDVILGPVLAVAGRRQGRSIPLVCKRWLRVFYSQPELWSSLEVLLPHEIAHFSSPVQKDDWFASTHARLQRCGHLVEVLQVCDAYRMQQIKCGPLPEGLLGNAVMHLRQLTLLHLQADELPAAVCQLTCLQQLQELYLMERRGALSADLVLPAPAAFRQLSTCRFTSLSARLQVDGTAGRLTMCGIIVKLADNGASACASGGGNSAASTAPGAAQGTVELACISPLGPLPLLLAAMLPAHVRLSALELSHGVLTPAALQDCPRLATLTRLVLSRCQGFADSGIGAPLDALLEQAPRLASLTLEGCLDEDDEGELPACLLASQGLREIGLHGNHLIGLPEGPYLGTSLEVLDLSGNSLEVVPAALAAATGLTKLDMSDNDDLEVTGDDVASVLMHMPRLQQLALDGANASLSALMTLARALPQLMLDDMGLPDMIKLSAAAD